MCRLVRCVGYGFCLIILCILVIIGVFICVLSRMWLLLCSRLIVYIVISMVLIRFIIGFS